MSKNHDVNDFAKQHGPDATRAKIDGGSATYSSSEKTHIWQAISQARRNCYRCIGWPQNRRRAAIHDIPAVELRRSRADC